MNTYDHLNKIRLRDLAGMVAKISPAEVNRKLENGEMLKLLEVSEPEDFDSGRINGAVNARLNSVVETARRLCRPYEQLVVYTAQASSSAGAAAAITLQKAGFQNVYVMTGGKEAWRDNGFLLVD